MTTAVWALVAVHAVRVPVAAAQVDPDTLPPLTAPGPLRLDLWQGPIYGSSQTLAMGGAQAALVEGATGMDVNPAAAAVRSPRSRTRWDWSANVDWLIPSVGADIDNNGIRAGDGGASGALYLLGAIAVQVGRWGFAADANYESYALEGIGSGGPELDTITGRLALARRFLDGIHAGLGIRYASTILAAGDDTLFRGGGAALEGGVLWRPPDLDLRVGGRASLPVVARPDETCAGAACLGYVIPDRMEAPWRVNLGAAWRFGPGRWNETWPGDFRDERQVIVSIEGALVGAVADGHGVEAYLLQRRQRTRSGLAWSLRGGAEVEAIPGWLRVRAGAYWEPPRVAEVSGRVHGTFGLELRLITFCLFETRYRVRLGLVGDAAPRYGNGGVSLGFWH